MKILLRGKNKLGFVNGTYKKDTPDHSLQELWESCDAIVMQLCAVMFEQLDLQERYDKIIRSRIFSLYQEIHSLHQCSFLVTNYYTKLRELWGAKFDLVALPSCKCDTLKSYGEMQQQNLMQFFMGLNDSYSATRSQILLMNTLPFVNHSYTMILEDERQKNIANSERMTPTKGVAMVAHGRGCGRGRGRGGPPPKCEHFHKKGHVKESCWEIVSYL